MDVRDSRDGSKKDCLLPVCALFLLISLAAGCKERTPELKIEAAQAAISPSILGVASVFMKISNTGRADDELLNASAEIPGTITELHDIQDGKMVKVGSIRIPAGESVVLRPARHHIMILKLPKDASEGYAFILTLSFQKSGNMKIPVQLTKFSPRMSLLRN